MENFNFDLSNVSESSGESIKMPPRGNYVARIFSCEFKAEAKPYFELLMDIAEGEFANYGENCETAFGNNYSYLTARWYATEKALGILKRNIKAVAESNPKIKIDCKVVNPQTIAKIPGCLVGVGVHVVERVSKTSGKAYKSLRVDNFGSVADARQGKIKMEDDELLNPSPMDVFGGTLVTPENVNVPF